MRQGFIPARSSTDFSVLKTCVPHRTLAGTICETMDRVQYGDGTIECATCGRTGGWGEKS